MTSKVLSIEQKIWQYIRRNKKFIFGNVMLVTGVGHKDLMQLLLKYESLGFIKPFRRDGSITERSFIVVEKLPLEIPDVNIFKTRNRSLHSLKKVLLYLEKCSDSDEVSLSMLERDVNLNKSQIRFCVEQLLKLEVLQLVRVRIYTVDTQKVQALLTFYKQKKHKEIESILEGKQSLVCVQLPLHLVEILEVILENEALKRDELSRLAGITRKNLTDWWVFLKKSGVMVDGFKESINERVTYVFSAKKAKKVLETLKKGAYEENKELKQLWLKQ